MRIKWFDNTGVVKVWREEYRQAKPKKGICAKGRDKCLTCTIPVTQCTGECKFKEDDNEPRATL